jgi:hypothetical protein
MVNLSTFLLQFSVEDDQFWSQKGGESVTKNQHNFFFIFYILSISIMPICKQQKN